jgi:hypothetical protein
MKKSFFIFFSLLTVFSKLLFGSEPEEEKKVLLVKSWQLLEGYKEVEHFGIDTGLLNLQITNPAFQNTISSSYLGNTGLPAIPDYFMDRNYFPEEIFSNYFANYFHVPESIRFYNTRRPYTRVGFTTAGPNRKNEKILSVLHTQNITPGFNIGFLYDNISSEGHYKRQNAKTNAISLFSSFKKGRYLFHTHFNINALQVLENGGLVDEQDLNRTDLGTEDLLVRLNNARTEQSNSSLLLVHKYQLLGKTSTDTLHLADEPMTLPGMRLGHIFLYKRTKRLFSDVIPAGSDFYPNYFIDLNSTKDSLYYRSFKNELFVEMPELRIKSFSFSIDAGISQELALAGNSIVNDTNLVYRSFQLINNQEVDTIVHTFRKETYSNYSLFGQATTSLTERITLNASLRYHFAGFRMNDFEFIAKGKFEIPLFGHEVILEPELQQLFFTPSYFLHNFTSNHFIWNNNFKQVKESSLGGRLIIPDLHLETGLRILLLNDFVYFNYQAVPDQHEDGIEILSVYAGKDFKFWRFNLRSRVAFQKSSNDQVIHFPELISYNSLTYTQTLVKDALTAQIGFDLYYNTPYYVPAYQPATSQFYLQNEKKYGGYPYLDGFINFALKRARIFVKAEHVNTGFLDRNYFTVLGYPRNGLVTRFGLIWNFYD